MSKYVIKTYGEPYVELDFGSKIEELEKCADLYGGMINTRHNTLRIYPEVGNIYDFSQAPYGAFVGGFTYTTQDGESKPFDAAKMIVGILSIEQGSPEEFAKIEIEVEIMETGEFALHEILDAKERAIGIFDDNVFNELDDLKKFIEEHDLPRSVVHVIAEGEKYKDKEGVIFYASSTKWCMENPYTGVIEYENPDAL